MKLHCHPDVTTLLGRLKPDISPDHNWTTPMKMLILAAFTALSLGVATTQEVHAAAPSATPTVEHSSPADDIGLSPSGSELEGGWG